MIISFTFCKKKRTVSGDLDKLKSRLVAGGHMIKAEELGDISFPTVKTESVKFLFGLAARPKLEPNLPAAQGVQVGEEAPPVLNAPGGQRSLQANTRPSKALCVSGAQGEQLVCPAES